MRFKITRALLLPLLLAVGACDPCAGTGACVDPHLYSEGRLLWHLTGEPASGVTVVFAPETGSALVPDSVVVQSNDQGVFRLQFDTGGAGQVRGTLRFRPPEPYEFFGFDLEGVQLVTTTVRGNPQFLGQWGVGPLPSPPHISYVGELFYLDTGARAVGVEVEFRRTGGIVARPEIFVVTTDAFGRFPLFMTPEGEGEVVGDILVRSPVPYRPLEIRGVRLPTLVGRDVIRLVGVWGIAR